MQESSKHGGCEECECSSLYKDKPRIDWNAATEVDRAGR